MTERLTVNWMFPDQLWLYGDRGNFMALRRLGALLGLDVAINRVTDLTVAPADLTIFSSGDLDVIGSLSARRDELADFISRSPLSLVFGTTVALFGRTTKRIGHPDVNGLGLVPADSVERVLDHSGGQRPYGDDLWLELAEPAAGETRCAGVYIKPIKVRLDAGVKPFASVLYGLDNSGELEAGGSDGAVLPDLVWTNLLGPALVRNPWLGLWLINRALGSAYEADERLRTAWELELAARDGFESFVTAKAKARGV